MVSHFTLQVQGASKNLSMYHSRSVVLQNFLFHVLPSYKGTSIVLVIRTRQIYWQSSTRVASFFTAVAPYTLEMSSWCGPAASVLPISVKHGPRCGL